MADTITVRVSRARKLTQFVHVEIPADMFEPDDVRGATDAAKAFVAAAIDAGQPIEWRNGSDGEMPRYASYTDTDMIASVVEPSEPAIAEAAE